MLEAKYWKIGNKKAKEVVCTLCHNECKIAEGKRGRCGVRLNKGGALFLDAHIASICIDPIEKKPFFHFLPGASAFSIGVFGCNFSCKYCQNWEISQISEVSSKLLDESLKCEDVSPENVVEDAKKSGCKVIAYTYTEPTIAGEYFEKIGKLAKKEGLKNVFVTNGFMNLDRVDVSWIDGFSFDIKGDEKFYEKVVGVKREAFEIILNNIKKLREKNKWVEVETLLVPGDLFFTKDVKGPFHFSELGNTDEKQLKKIAEGLVSIDKNIPWHILAFYPCYKMCDHKPTSRIDIENAIKIGKKAGLKYVYAGNVGQGEETFCSKCNKKLIERRAFSTRSKIVDGCCPFCREKIAGVWE